MSVAIVWAWVSANQALIATVLFAVSEALGANPKIKANGILSLIIIQAQNALKVKGAKDITPWIFYDIQIETAYRGLYFFINTF